MTRSRIPILGLALVAGMLAAPAVQAQQRSAKPREPGVRRPPVAREARAAIQKKLDLSEAQREQVKAILKEQRGATRELVEVARSARTQRRQALREVLTPEQQGKLERLRKAKDKSKDKAKAGSKRRAGKLQRDDDRRKPKLRGPSLRARGSQPGRRSI